MSQQTNNLIDINSIQVNISDIEMNTLDCFIDFLKGILRIEKEFRWTPSMALEHPFITRTMFTGHFEPKREEEKKRGKPFQKFTSIYFTTKIDEIIYIFFRNCLIRIWLK